MHDLTWADAYGANFRKLTPADIAAWEIEIRDRITDLRAGEALRAVRSIAELCRTGQWRAKTMPTANHVIGTIIRNRYEDRTGHMMKPVTRQEDFLNMVKGKMRATNAFYMRWNIMCSPDIYAKMERTTTGEECDMLNQWASGVWPDWHKPDLDEIAGFPS